MQLTDTGKCIVCGKNNPHGLQLTLSVDRERLTAHTAVTIPERFVGWESFVHGGVVAMLLDEAMAYAAMAGGRYCVTAEMKVRFKQPVSPQVPLDLFGEVTAVKGRIIETRAVLRDGERILAEAEGRMVVPRDATET